MLKQRFILIVTGLILISANDRRSEFIDNEKVTSIGKAANAIATADHLTGEEKAMILAINRLRSDPRAYLEKVYRAYNEVLGDSTTMSGQRSEVITTQWVFEGDDVMMITDTTYKDHYADVIAAYEDLIQDLLYTGPLPALLPSEELHAVAMAHGVDQSPSNYIQHWDSQGRWPLERIMAAASWVDEANENIAAGGGDAEAILLQLMVDSGVDGYGHRKNILNPSWQYVTCHKVSSISTGTLSWWIQEFASGPRPS